MLLTWLATGQFLKVDMTINFKDTGDNYRQIVLSGRLDSAGADAIAIQFAALSATARRRIVVDLSEVSFLASIGIRLLVQNAKALHARNGRMVLFVGQNDQVRSTIETTGITSIIPMFTDAAEAVQAALVSLE